MPGGRLGAGCFRACGGLHSPMGATRQAGWADGWWVLSCGCQSRQERQSRGTLTCHRENRAVGGVHIRASLRQGLTDPSVPLGRPSSLEVLGPLGGTLVMRQGTFPAGNLH